MTAVDLIISAKRTGRLALFVALFLIPLLAVSGPVIADDGDDGGDTDDSWYEGWNFSGSESFEYRFNDELFNAGEEHQYRNMLDLFLNKGRWTIGLTLNGANFLKVVPFPGTKMAEMWAETYQGPAGVGGPSPKEGGEGEAYRDFWFLSRNLPAPPERMMLVDAMQARAYYRFYGNPLRSARYVLRHPNKGLALHNLWSMSRNVAVYFRDRWFRPEMMRRGPAGREEGAAK